MSDYVINHADSGKRSKEIIQDHWYLWMYWVLANLIGVVIGMGSVFLVGTGVAPGIETYMGKLADLIIAGILIITGTLVEGTVLGTVQWIVLHHINKSIKWLAWVNATLIGVFIAWVLGTIPSTLVEFGINGIRTTLGELNLFLDYVIVGALGLVLGSVLGLPQWLLIRLYFSQTEWWVPANALAWMFGMIILFSGIDVVSTLGLGLKTATVILITLIVTGAVVGAIHGLVLVRLVPQKNNSSDN